MHHSPELLLPAHVDEADELDDEACDSDGGAGEDEDGSEGVIGLCYYKSAFFSVHDKCVT